MCVGVGVGIPYCSMFKDILVIQIGHEGNRENISMLSQVLNCLRGLKSQSLENAHDENKLEKGSFCTMHISSLAGGGLPFPYPPAVHLPDVCPAFCLKPPSSSPASLRLLATSQPALLDGLYCCLGRTSPLALRRHKGN